MRALILAFALPLGLVACAEDPYDGYDTDGDGLLSESEYDAGIGDADFGAYDVDGDGFINEEEYDVYE
jgi:hypothetical protein